MPPSIGQQILNPDSAKQRLLVSRRVLGAALLLAPAPWLLGLRFSIDQFAGDASLSPPPDPEIMRVSAGFLDMLALRGVALYPRGPSASSIDISVWQKLAPIERVAIVNAVAGRAFGKMRRSLAPHQEGRIFALKSGDLLAVASLNGVTILDNLGERQAEK